jgi:hypothetical protein
MVNARNLQAVTYKEWEMSEKENEGYLDGVTGYLGQSSEAEYSKGYDSGHLAYYLTHGHKLNKRCPVEGYPEE